MLTCKLKIPLLWLVVRLGVKNSSDMRATHGGEECVMKVQHDSSATQQASATPAPTLEK